MGEAAIYEDLIQHERWLKRLARQLVSGDEAASELVQETFVRAIATPPADLTRPKAWLETVLRNLAASFHRRRAPENLDALEVSEALSTSATMPEHAIERFEAARSVSEAVEALPAREKHVVLMHWQEGLDVGEIARSLAVTESAIRKQLTSAHGRLRRKLRRDYGDGGWVQALAPLIALRAPRTAAAPATASAASVALVAALAVAGLCAITIPVWSAATSGGDEDAQGLTGGGRPAPGQTPAGGAEIMAGGAGLPRGTQPVRAPVPIAGRAGDAGAVASGTTSPGTETKVSEAQDAAIPLAGVTGKLILDGEPITKWAARLEQLEGCVEDCTVRARMTDSTFDLQSRSFGHHRLVLDSEVVEGVYSTLRMKLQLGRGQKLELDLEQVTTGLTVSGVPDHYPDLFAYWTDGAGTEFMQRVRVQSGTAAFPSAPIGPVEIKVRHDHIADPSGWAVLGQVRLSAGERSTLTLLD